MKRLFPNSLAKNETVILSNKCEFAVRNSSLSPASFVKQKKKVFIRDKCEEKKNRDTSGAVQ